MDEGTLLWPACNTSVSQTNVWQISTTYTDAYADCFLASASEYIINGECEWAPPLDCMTIDLAIHIISGFWRDWLLRSHGIVVIFSPPVLWGSQLGYRYIVLLTYPLRFGCACCARGTGLLCAILKRFCAYGLARSRTIWKHYIPSAVFGVRATYNGEYTEVSWQKLRGLLLREKQLPVWHWPAFQVAFNP